MKYSLLLSLFFLLNCFPLCAQGELSEAKKLYAEKKYEAAGVIYYDHYLFDQAVEAFEKRIEFLKKIRKPDQEAIATATVLLEKAQRAARMLAHGRDVQIVDSMIVKKADFLKVYLLGDESGTLTPAKGSVVYENQLKDRRYYGKPDSSGMFHLYGQTLVNGRWAEERPLNIPSDSLAGDNYPFVMPDGMTTYFASTGNGSIGGYDLFVTRYNLNSDSYLAPSQLGMPFNSIYNDYMLAIDEENGIGYFVTDRFQEEDHVIVYSFIPAEEYGTLNDLDEEALTARAKITSIRNTWAPGANYSDYKENIKQQIERRRMIAKREFVFPINDNIIYYMMSDFESDAAKRSFLSAQDIRKQRVQLETTLDNQRKEFALSASPSKKEQLRGKIEKDELSLENMERQLAEAEKAARNQEIRHLRQQQ